MTNVTVSPSGSSLTTFLGVVIPPEAISGVLSTSGLGLVNIHINSVPISGAVITFTSTLNSTTATINHTGHGALEGDFVTFTSCELPSQFSSLVTLLVKEHEVVTVPNSDTYTITLSANAGFTLTNSGLIEAEYQLNRGSTTQLLGSGWGAGTWGAGTWGSATAITDANQLRIWSQDNFGEDLVINVRAGGIFYYDTSAGTLGTTRATALADLAGANLAPTKALQVLVSDVDRHVICFGADPISGSSRSGTLDPMLIAFSDQENVTEWEPKSTNTAGSLRLSAGSSIVGALRARQETLVWTDTSLYSMTFIGQPFTFGLNLVNEGVGLISPNGAVNSPKGVFWMDKKGFYNYNGQVQDIPCTVQNYVFSDFNEGQSFQVFGFLNKEFDEVGWFYVSSSASTIDRYVVFNYEEGSWTIGQLNRSAWVDEGIFDNPMATSSGYLYNHEIGNDDDGSPMDNVFIESSDFDIGDGEDFQAVNRIIPDIKFTGSGGTGQTVNFVVKTRNFPAESLTTSTTSTCTSSTSKIDTRIRARQAVLRIESDDDNDTGARIGVGFRVGATRMSIYPNGKR